MHKTINFAGAVSLAMLSHSLLAATEADIESSFFPYAKGMPTFPGYTPGMKITKENVDRFKDIIDPADFMMVKNGWYEIKTTPTISFDVVQKYIDATKAGLNKTQLGTNPGEISGYIGGRPFPEEPQSSDPRAGEKIAWNFRFGVGETFSIKPIQWKYRDLMSGKVERSLLVTAHAMKFKYRVETPPILS